MRAPAGPAAEPCGDGQASVYGARKQLPERQSHADARLPPHPEGEEELPGATGFRHGVVTAQLGRLVAQHAYHNSTLLWQPAQRVPDMIHHFFWQARTVQQRRCVSSC